MLGFNFSVGLHLGDFGEALPDFSIRIRSGSCIREMLRFACISRAMSAE